jgi:hypothetical protein
LVAVRPAIALATFRIWVSGNTIFKAGFVIGFNASVSITFGKGRKKRKVAMVIYWTKPPIKSATEHFHRGPNCPRDDLAGAQPISACALDARLVP